MKHNIEITSEVHIKMEDNNTEITSKDLMIEFCKDPLNLKITFFMNDVKPADFSTGELQKIMREQMGVPIGNKHIRSCITALKKFDIIRTSRKISGIKMYAFNSGSELATKIFELEEAFDEMFSVIMNLPPRPIFVDKKYYEDREGIPANWRR